MDFGSSGSGAVRVWKKSSVKRYSFAGPLTMSKGCDEAIELTAKLTGGNSRLRKYIYRVEMGIGIFLKIA